MCLAKLKVSRNLSKMQRTDVEGDEETNLKQNRLHSLVIVSLVLVCYTNSLWCELVFDDIPAIEENKDLRPWTPVGNLLRNDFWGTPLMREESHKSYRPLCVLTFRLNYWIHELEPFGYHFVNIIIHAFVCILFYRFCTEFLPSRACLLSAVLFASHPIHTEAVTGVVGRAELLSSLFFLLAIMDYVRSSKKNVLYDLQGTIRYFILTSSAVLCKEQGITVVGTCALLDVVLLKQPTRCGPTANKALRSKVKGPTPTWRKDLILRLLRLSSIAGLILVFRLRVMASKLPIFNKFDNPASASSSPARELTFNYLPAFNFWLLLFPLDLCCDWSMGSIPLISSWLDKRNVATLLLYISIVRLVQKCKRCLVRKRVVTVGLGLLIIPYIPASNLFFPVGFVVAERVLYIPSMGLCILVAYGYHMMWNLCIRKQIKYFLAFSIFTITCLNVARTITRNFDWRNEESLFTAGLRVSPRNAKLWNNLGHVMQSKGDSNKALDYFLMAVEIQPDDVGGHMNVGNAYNAMGRSTEAEEAFWKARDLLPSAGRAGHPIKAYVSPRHMELFSHLGNLISKNESRLEEAQELLLEATKMKPDFINAYLERASILLKLNRSTEARMAYRQALKYDGSNPDIFYNIGVLLLEEGNEKQALAHFDKALSLDPQHEKSLINFAILSQDSGDSEHRRIAQQRLQKQIDKGALASERIFFNMGVLAMEDREHAKAEEYFKKAIQQRSDFVGALFNMALLLHNTGRPVEAVPHLEALLKHEPYHIKGLMVLGNIYFSHLKNYTAAKTCYGAILTKNPDHVPAFHNMCAVYIQTEELDKAESCLLQARSMAPDEEYVVENLNLVRQRKRFSNGNNENDQTQKIIDSVVSPNSDNDTSPTKGSLRTN